MAHAAAAAPDVQTEPALPLETDTGRARTALVALCLVGVALRVARWAYDASFWGDEACLILNFRDYGLGRLLTGRLDATPFTQVGPPLWLVLHDAICQLVGVSERAMRLPGLLASCAALPLMAFAARRMLPPPAAVAAVALLALSDKVVYQAANLKPYSFDLLATCALLAIAATRWREATKFAVLAAVAVAGLGFSFAVPFVFAGLSLAALLRSGARRWWWAGNVAFTAAAVAVYLVTVRGQRDAFLDDFWARTAGAFPGSYRPDQLFVWLADQSTRLAGYAAAPAGVALIAPVSLAAWGWRRRVNWPVAAAVSGPVVLAVVAAIARQYPFGGQRVMLWSLPLIFLAAGAGAAWLRATVARWPGWIGYAVVAAVVGGAAFVAVRDAARPDVESDLRPVLDAATPERLAAAGADVPVYVISVSDSAIVRTYRPDLPPTWRPDTPKGTLPADVRYWLVITGDFEAKRDRFKPAHRFPLPPPGYRLVRDQSILRQGGGLLLIEREPAGR
jgi:hypothetical protein